MAKRKRKPHRKYRSKYYRKYGYSIKDVVMFTGWSYGSVHAAFQVPSERRAMLELVKVEEECSVVR